MFSLEIEQWGLCFEWPCSRTEADESEYLNIDPFRTFRELTFRTFRDIKPRNSGECVARASRR